MSVASTKVSRCAGGGPPCSAPWPSSQLRLANHIYIYNARESCLRFETDRVEVTATSAKKFQLCTYLGDIPNFFWDESQVGNPLIEHHLRSEIQQNPKNPKFRNRDLACVGPGYRSQMVSGVSGDGFGPAGSFSRRPTRENVHNSFFGNRKVALCKFEIRRFGDVWEVPRKILYDHRISFQNREIERY